MNGVTLRGRGKTNPHIFFAQGEALGAPGLRAVRCRACGRYTLGRVAACTHCFSREIDVVAAGQQAELVEYSIAHHSAGGFEAPYAIGQVRTSEGLVLFVPLTGETAGLQPGERLSFVVVDHRGGALGFAYARDRSNPE
jgi:uncharacterized OB-fold protein